MRVTSRRSRSKAVLTFVRNCCENSFSLSVNQTILVAVPGKKEKQPLSVTHPELAKEADGWDPSEFLPMSNFSKTWKCSVGHFWDAVIASRTRGRGCPYCSNRKLLIGFNDLMTTHPDLALEAYNWDPKTEFAGSHNKREWRCSKGHITLTEIKARAISGNSCRICMNQEVLFGYNDLASSHPEIAKEAFGWDPSRVISGSNIDYEWKCPLGHIYKCDPGSRTRGTGCNICAGKKILIGFNDLGTTHPEVAKQAFGWDPQGIFGGTHSIKTFRCNLGHKYDAIVKDRTVKNSGCPTCSKTGFNPTAEGYLYFLEHPRWQMFQIGITNFPDDRLGSHKKLGWELLELRGPMDGHLTKQWETAILRMLKAKGADLSNSKIAGKFDGYSEAWSKSTFEVKTIKELMKLTEEFEEKH